jgi:hypothetical protein
MKKYIILSGCSYSYKWDLPILLKELIANKKLLDIFEFELIQIGASSAGNEYISESTIIVSKCLLDSGVLPKDILVINNFTQIGRPVVKLPHEYHKKVEHLFNDDNCDKRIFGNIIYASSASLLKLQNEVYSFLITNHNLSDDVKDWFNYQSKIYRVNRIVEQYFERYLESIIIMQSFLKKHNILNISFLMNNVFDGWDNKFGHVYNGHTELNIPSTTGTKHISEITDYTKVLWDCIDLNSFIFHQTNENKYGGIDEYMLDRYPDRNYFQNPERLDLIFGNHPSGFIYKKFTEEYMLEKLNKWVNEIHS